jgi:hypothetical protein
MQLERNLIVVILVFALGMSAIGLTLIALPSRENIVLFGHHPDSMIQVFGGRYVAMSLMIAGLLWLRQWLAISVVLTVGALMGFLDAWLVSRAGASIVPHVIAGVVCVILAVLAKTVSEKT